MELPHSCVAAVVGTAANSETEDSVAAVQLAFAATAETVGIVGTDVAAPARQEIVVVAQLSLWTTCHQMEALAMEKCMSPQQ